MTPPVASTSVHVAKISQAGIPAPQQDLYAEIRNLYVRMTGKNPDGRLDDKTGFYDKLDKALKDKDTPDIITREELGEIFNQKMTEEAYLAFTGNAKFITLDLLKEDLIRYIEFQNLTAVPFSYFAECDRIIPIPKFELAKVFDAAQGGLSDTEMESFTKEHDAILQSMLRYFTGKSYAKVTVEDIKNLKPKDKEWLSVAFFYKFYESVLEKGVKFSKKLENPLVARFFRQTMFKDYLTKGKGATEENMAAFEDQADKLIKLGTLVGEDAFQGKDLASSEFNKFLKEADIEAGKAKLLTQIEKLPKIDNKSGAIPNGLPPVKVVGEDTIEVAAQADTGPANGSVITPQNPTISTTR